MKKEVIPTEGDMRREREGTDTTFLRAWVKLSSHIHWTWVSFVNISTVKLFEFMIPREKAEEITFVWPDEWGFTTHSGGGSRWITKKNNNYFPHLVEGSNVPTPHDICNICMSHRLSFLWFLQRWASGMQRYFPHSTSGHSHKVPTPYCYDIKATKPRDQLVPLRRDQSLQVPA